MINPNKLNATKLLVDKYIYIYLFLIINFSLHKMLRETICIAKTHSIHDSHLDFTILTVVKLIFLNSQNCS